MPTPAATRATVTMPARTVRRRRSDVDTMRPLPRAGTLVRRWRLS
jgi:hypothetical protein